MVAVFLKPSESLKVETTKGELEILPNEYFILSDERKVLVINKEGIQKIEDFFQATTEIIEVGAALDSIYVSVRMKTPDGLTIERLGSSNNGNLKNDIARAYPVEMAFKRACATASLEILRKNYVGEKQIPLLYSSFDEFKAEKSINEDISILKEEREIEEKREIKKDEKQENRGENIASSLGQYVLKTNRYRNGITLAELLQKDPEYLKWLVEKANNLGGKYKEYQEKAKAFLEQNKL